MRSDILAQELRERREKKRLERKRRQNAKNQRAWYKRQKEAERKAEVAKIQRHPKMSNEETAAVEAAIAWESGKQRTDAHVFTPGQAESVLQTPSQTVIQPAVVPTDVIRPEARPAPDCVAAMLEHDRRLAPHLEELKILKYGEPQPEQKVTIPPPFDTFHGIIL